MPIKRNNIFKSTSFLKKGGRVLELTDAEIKAYKKGGYIVEEYNDGGAQEPPTRNILTSNLTFVPNQSTQSSFTKTTTSMPKPKYRDPKVVAKQKELIAAGYDIGGADGIWGKKSQAAWEDFQAQQSTTPEQKVKETVEKTKESQQVLKKEQPKGLTKQVSKTEQVWSDSLQMYVPVTRAGQSATVESIGTDIGGRKLKLGGTMGDPPPKKLFNFDPTPEYVGYQGNVPVSESTRVANTYRPTQQEIKATKEYTQKVGATAQAIRKKTGVSHKEAMQQANRVPQVQAEAKAYANTKQAQERDAYVFGEGMNADDYFRYPLQFLAGKTPTQKERIQYRIRATDPRTSRLDKFMGTVGEAVNLAPEALLNTGIGLAFAPANLSKLGMVADAVSPIGLPLKKSVKNTPKQLPGSGVSSSIDDVGKGFGLKIDDLNSPDILKKSKDVSKNVDLGIGKFDHTNQVDYKNGLQLHTYSKPGSNVDDVILVFNPKTNENIAYMRNYKIGDDWKPTATNEWHIKADMPTADKDLIKFANKELEKIVQVKPTKFEGKTISTDGLRYWNQQQKYGYFPTSNTTTPSISPAGKDDLFKGLNYNKTDDAFEGLKFKTKKDASEGASRLTEFMKSQGLDYKVIIGKDNSLKVNLPKLQRAFSIGGAIATGAAASSNEYQQGGIVLNLSEDKIRKYQEAGYVIEKYNEGGVIMELTEKQIADYKKRGFRVDDY